MKIRYTVLNRTVPEDLLNSAGVDQALSMEEAVARTMQMTKAVTAETHSRTGARETESASGGRKTLVQEAPMGLIATCPAASYGLKPEDEALAEAVRDKAAWGIGKVDALESVYDGAGVTVAVLDTGIKTAHPAFRGMDIQGESFVGNRASFEDDHGHGTHCAGTIAGQAVDGVRIGVAPGIKRLLVAKVLDHKGQGTTSSVADGLQWAYSQKAQVISMSLGFNYAGLVQQHIANGWPPDVATSVALEGYREAIAAFGALLDQISRSAVGAYAGVGRVRGAVLVAASGNDSRRHHDPEFVLGASVPAVCSDAVLRVGAAQRDAATLGVAPFSNTGVNLCAPGVGIVSADYKTLGLIAMNGTSMACPHVAGLAALHWQARGEDATAENVRAAVLISGSRTAFTGFNPQDCGEGLPYAPQAALG